MTALANVRMKLSTCGSSVVPGAARDDRELLGRRRLHERRRFAVEEALPVGE